MSATPPSFPNCYHLRAYSKQYIFPAAFNPDDFDDAPGVNEGLNTSLPLLVVAPVKVGGAEFQRWYPQPQEATGADGVKEIFVPEEQAPDTDIGVVMGLIKHGDPGSLDFDQVVTGQDNEWIILPEEAVGETEIYNSVSSSIN